MGKYIIFKTESMSDSGWEERVLAHTGALTDILAEHYDSSNLGAERLIAAEKSGEKIAVEIKTFASASKISKFHTALGQFINYRTVLRIEQPDRKLFLAVPLVT